jgi:hypothetical protein
LLKLKPAFGGGSGWVSASGMRSPKWILNASGATVRLRVLVRSVTVLATAIRLSGAPQLLDPDKGSHGLLAARPARRRTQVSTARSTPLSQVARLRDGGAAEGEHPPASCCPRAKRGRRPRSAGPQSWSGSDRSPGTACKAPRCASTRAPLAPYALILDLRCLSAACRRAVAGATGAVARMPATPCVSRMASVAR